MTESLSENTFMIICPVCNGAGRLRTLECAECAGAGLGGFANGSVYFFKLPLSRTIINFKKIQKIVKAITDGLAYVLACAGLAAFIYWLTVHGEIMAAARTMAPAALERLAFWNVQHWLLLLFWLSLIPAAFVIYRAARRTDSLHLIRPLTYRSSLNEPIAPSDWRQIAALPRSQKVNVAAGADETVEKILEQAFMMAENLQHGEVGSLHLFAATLMMSTEASALFARLNLSEKQLINRLEKKLSESPRRPLTAVFGPEARQIMIQAYLAAAANRQDRIRELDLLLPAFDLNPFISELLYELETDRAKLANGIAWFKIADKLADNQRQYRRLARYKPASTMDRAYTAIATPLLDHFSHDITLAAKWGRVEICLERDKEVREVFDRLESGRAGVILVGPDGVGKDTIIGGIAQLMVLEDVPALLADKRLIELDVARLIGGASPAEAEDNLLRVITEVSRAGNIILYIKDIERLSGIGSGGEESLNLAGVLADAIDRGHLICFASATDERYRKYIEQSALGSALAPVLVNEPDRNAAIVMIESKVGWYEHKYGVYFSYDALAEVVNLTDRYIHDKYLPAKAFEVLESVAVNVSRRQNKIVDREAIAQVITELTRIPVTKLTTDESESLLNLEARLHERMVGQDEAVKMVSAALRRARVELREHKRPIANFLFLGPTGVGKTELAKTVSEMYFGREDYMIRLDMSEYQEQSSLIKMIGSPDGVLGYLTEAVRRLPFTLILLDEIEKAHADILNLFLQVMDDGRLTDGQGRTVDFTNSIIIATSNVGSSFIQEKIRAGTDIAAIKDALIKDELVKVMRPELINRFDGVIVFTPLDGPAMIAITRLMLKKMAALLEAKGFGFSVSDAAIERLAELGFEPEYGARPLRRLLQEKVEDAIATKILGGEIGRRDTIIVKDDLTISVKKAPRL